MNTRQTVRNRSEYERDNTTDEERDRERDEYERLLEQEESRTRQTDRRKSRDAMSRRVTGAKQPTSNSTRSSKRLWPLLPAEAEVDVTPPKQPHKAAVRAQALISRRAHPITTGTRYRGTEPPAAGRKGLETQTQYSEGEGVGVSRERRRLFTDMDTMADIFRGATEEVEPEEIGELVAALNPQQLAASLQHMALKWRELKGGNTEETQTCRPPAVDSRSQRPHTRTYPGTPHTPPRRTQRRPTESARIWDEDRSPDHDRDHAGPPRVAQQRPVRDVPVPPNAQPATTTDGSEEDATGDNDKLRKPAANRLETYAGQGASVESFIAKFESHAKYYKWSEQDRVFQLKNSLTGTAAQALWTGGENATLGELIKLLHSRHGSKLQTERWWSELRARRRQPNEPLQAVCQDIRRLMYLASPHETGPLAEHISIDFYVAAICDPNMPMFVMSRNPDNLEDALNHSARYEALLLGASESTQAVVLDPASYVYDDKGRRKEPSVRAIEVQQYTKQQDLERSLAAQKALNDESQRKLAEQQALLDQWSAWNTDQTRLSGQAQPAHYDWRQSNYASGGGQQAEEDRDADARHTPHPTRMRTPTGQPTAATTVEERDTSRESADNAHKPAGQQHIGRHRQPRPLTRRCKRTPSPRRQQYPRHTSKSTYVIKHISACWTPGATTASYRGS